MSRAMRYGHDVAHLGLFRKVVGSCRILVHAHRTLRYRTGVHVRTMLQVHMFTIRSPQEAPACVFEIAQLACVSCYMAATDNTLCHC